MIIPYAVCKNGSLIINSLTCKDIRDMKRYKHNDEERASDGQAEKERERALMHNQMSVHLTANAIEYFVL